MAVTAYIEFEQTLVGNGRPVQGNVVVSSTESLPVAISGIMLVTYPLGAPVQLAQPYFGAGGGGAATGVPVVPYIVNPNATLRFPFTGTAFALPNAPGNATVGGTVTLSSGTSVTVRPASITAYPMVVGVEGSGLYGRPPFLQTTGAAMFDSNSNSDVATVVVDE